MSCSSVNPTRDLPSCKLLGITEEWAALLAFGQKSLSSLDLTPHSGSTHLLAPSSPLPSFLLYPAPFASPVCPTCSCLGDFSSCFLLILSYPSPIPDDLPHPILVGFSAIHRALNFLQGILLISGVEKRKQRSQGEHWGLPSGCSSTVQ